MNVIKKRLAPSLLVLFLVILAGFTLFSNTLRTMTLPKVITEKPSPGPMNHLVEGNGVVSPGQQDDLISESGWKVTKVYVKQGDSVAKGQALVAFDGTELEQTLLDEEASRRKRMLEKEDVEEQFKVAMQHGDEDAILKAKRDLQTYRLDEETSARKINALRNELEQKKMLTAPYDGIISDVQAREGLRVPQGQKALSLVSPGKGFEVSFTVRADSAALLMLEEEIPVIVILGGQAKRMNGRVAEFKDRPSDGANGDGTGTQGISAAQRIVVVALAGEELKGGEQASIRIEKPSLQEGMVLRKEYTKNDGKGRYVFVVQENKSSLGNAYYAQKKYIRVLDETAEELVVEGLHEQMDVITESSVPLQDGNQIRLQ